MIVLDPQSWQFTFLLRWKGSVLPNATVMALPAGLLCVLMMVLNDEFPDFRESFGSDSITASQLWAALTASLIFCIGFRTNKAYARFWEGTTLLHQMRGEWFDAVSCLIAFSQLALKESQTKNDEVLARKVRVFRHCLVRLMSLCHGSALEQIQLDKEEPENPEEEQDPGAKFKYIDLGGLDQETLRYLRDAKYMSSRGTPMRRGEGKGHGPADSGLVPIKFNRVEVLIHMMQTLIVSAQDTGVLKIAPPILSRVFQTLSRGQVNVMNCSKIKHTYFPFPYVQLISFLLLLLNVMTPMLMSGVLQHKQWGFICTFVPIFGLNALNYAATELEMPFGDDSNDLPLQLMQEEMNISMLMLLYKDVDLVAGISPECAHDFTVLESRVTTDDIEKFVERGREPDSEPLQRVSTPKAAAAAPPVAAAPAAAPAAIAAAPAKAAAASAGGLHPSLLSLEVKVIQQTALIDRHLKSFERATDSFDSLVHGTASLIDMLKQNSQILGNLSKDIAALSRNARAQAPGASPLSLAPLHSAAAAQLSAPPALTLSTSPAAGATTAAAAGFSASQSPTATQGSVSPLKGLPSPHAAIAPAASLGTGSAAMQHGSGPLAPLTPIVPLVPTPIFLQRQSG